jgi:hypothetical protein
MAALVKFDGVAPAPRGSAAIRLSRRVAIEFAALAAHGWDTAAQIAVFVWMALVVALFGVIAAGFLLA